MDLITKNKMMFSKKTPISIHADKGTEFNNNLVINFFHDKNIGLRFSATGRHSQQAVVERMNRTIGETINKLQLHNENITGEEYTDWIDFLPDIIEAVNEHAKETKKPLPFKNDNADVRCNGTECEIYETGTKVRIALDYPTDVNGKRIYGKFRAGDRRFSLKPYIIENVLMFPNQPIRYVIQGVKNNTFSKAELLPYIAPKTKQLSDGKFVIEKIIDQKKVGNRIFYLVKWEGYDDDQNTWEPRTELIKDNALPSIQQFLSNQKKK